MGYDFGRFCTDLKTILKTQGIAGIDALAKKLEHLLAEPDFVAMAFPIDAPPGKRLLFHDPDSDARVQAHVHSGGKSGPPHSHGASWAIYGSARGYTDMIEWARVNPDTDDHAELEAVSRYRLGPGEARAYPPHRIHSTAHPETACVIRIIGTDLDSIPRFRFRASRDKLVERAEGGR